MMGDRSPAERRARQARSRTPVSVCTSSTTALLPERCAETDARRRSAAELVDGAPPLRAAASPTTRRAFLPTVQWFRHCGLPMLESPIRSPTDTRRGAPAPLAPRPTDEAWR